LVTNIDGQDGGFEGRFTATLRAFDLAGQTVEKGFGVWSGWQARTDFHSTDPDPVGRARHEFTGFLFNPGG
jgi:hypothetical protein